MHIEADEIKRREEEEKEYKKNELNSSKFKL
jgi:hypothetical protein